MYTYSSLKRKVKKMATIIDAPDDLLPDFGRSNQIAHPFVLIKFPFLHLMVCENGMTIKNERFKTEDALLFAIFENITFNMAMMYEVTHRIPNQDFRRVLFAHQIELMERLSVAWKNQLQEKIDDILSCYPFGDTHQ